MITKTNAVKKSKAKWERIVNGKGSIHDDCGFCDFVIAKAEDCDITNEDCEQHCSLYPDICATDGNEKPDALYWKCRDKPSKKLATKILQAIIKRGEKWIRGEYDN